MTSLTRVALICVPDQHNVWLRFGRPVWEEVPDEHLCHVCFPPGAVFARVEWRADAHCPIHTRLAILRAAGPGERIACLDGIAPGAQLLLHATTSGKTQQVLRLIDAIEAQRIAPEAVSEDYWRVLHQRLVAGIEPPVYSAAEHAAVQQRRALLS